MYEEIGDEKGITLISAFWEQPFSSLTGKAEPGQEENKKVIMEYIQKKDPTF